MCSTAASKSLTTLRGDVEGEVFLRPVVLGRGNQSRQITVHDDVVHLERLEQLRHGSLGDRSVDQHRPLPCCRHWADGFWS